MKANKSSRIEADDKAVSAVIGVILMVAITVAISASVYVYANDMIGTGMTIPPTLSFFKSGNNLVVIKTSADLPWNLFSANITGGTNASISYPSSGSIEAGQSIRLVNSSGVTLRVVYGDTLMGSWTW